MFLYNWANFAATVATYGWVNSDAAKTIIPNPQDIYGNKRSGFYLFDAYVSSNHISTFYFDSFILGTGNTKPKYTDYQLESRVDTTLFSNKTFSFIPSMNNGNVSILCTCSGVYNGDDDIIIKEIGITKNLPLSWASGGTCATAPFLMTRDLLENPITLKKGQSFTIVYIVEVGN